MFKPDLAAVLANDCEIAEARLSEYEAAIGDMLAKYGLRINYLAYFEDALGIPVALELNLDDLSGEQEDGAEPDNPRESEKMIECIRRHCRIYKHEQSIYLQG